AVSLKSESFLAGARIPELHRPIPTCGGEAFAVRTERHALDIVGVSFESETFLACARIPDLHQVITCGSEALAIRTERHAGTVALESESFLTGARIPYLHRLVPTCGGEMSA